MNIAEILAFSEQPDDYKRKVVEIDMGQREIFVISDLHMAAGLNENGNYDGTENFFADASISRFISHLENKIYDTKKGLLIINGDFVDFLRVRNIPETNEDFIRWSALLAELGTYKNKKTLQDSIIERERRYGLRTNDYKSVWKLDVCFRGHRSVFKCLASWLEKGNELLIIKGNHDLEWFWKPVRDQLRLILAKQISENQNISPDRSLKEIVIPSIHFADDKVLIDGRIYIEHGHRYEHFTKVDGPAVLKGSDELNLPFGSFFNRYLINRIELAYPFIDDVRPRQQILPLLIRERFPLALRLLFRYVPFLVQIIPKRQYAFALRYVFQFLLIIGIPLLITGYALIKSLSNSMNTPPACTSPSFFMQYIFPQLKSLALLSLSYFMGRLFSILRLSAPSSFYPNALKIFKDHPTYELITFGHTHDPEQKKSRGRAYYNTGTWIPVFELDAADVRLDKTYTFLQLTKDTAGKIQTEGLMRWNDDADRTEKMKLRDSI